jgi:hypothetical protein
MSPGDKGSDVSWLVTWSAEASFLGIKWPGREADFFMARCSSTEVTLIFLQTAGADKHFQLELHKELKAEQQSLLSCV